MGRYTCEKETPGFMTLAPCEQYALDAAPEAARQEMESALAATTAAQARAVFARRLGMYRRVEENRDPFTFLHLHECGGHLRPLFALWRLEKDESIIQNALKVSILRRQWAAANLFRNYPDCNEVHHDPETFLYFQIPLLDITGEAGLTKSITDVADMAGNWAEGVPAWYDWETHGFRSTRLGSRRVEAEWPHDYQEANHFRIISIALAAYRHARQDRYLELAVDYADRWRRHIAQCRAAGEPVVMQILPPGATAVEMGHGGALLKQPEPGQYMTFYTRVASNTAYDVIQGLQDVARLSGENRFLDAAGEALAQFRENRDPATGRWPHSWSGGEWRTSSNGGKPPLAGDSNTFLARAALRQAALRPEDAGLRDDLAQWAESALQGREPFEFAMNGLLFAGWAVTGREDFLAAGYRRLAAGMALTFSHPEYHICGATTRPGYGLHVEWPLTLEAGYVDNGTRGSWPLRWPFELGKR